jgi:hypothetical protein
MTPTQVMRFLKLVRVLVLVLRMKLVKLIPSLDLLLLPLEPRQRDRISLADIFRLHTTQTRGFGFVAFDPAGFTRTAARADFGMGLAMRCHADFFLSLSLARAQ